MEVEIKGEKLKFEIGSIWGVIYYFEMLTDGRMAFDMGRILCLHIAMYGVLLRCNPGMVLGFDEFVEELNHVELAKALTDHFVKRFEILSQGEQVAHTIKGLKEQPEGEEPKEPEADKKKERTGAKASTATKCIGKLWAGWAWIRRIF